MQLNIYIFIPNWTPIRTITTQLTNRQIWYPFVQMNTFITQYMHYIFADTAMFGVGALLDLFIVRSIVRFRFVS